ncbi:hypothetical protein BD560DRAFT_460532, partial [Blakeslea trispora]
VSAKSITLEAKGSDSSLKINFMINNNNYPMMFYFLRFFRKGSTHRIIGSLNVSAYMFDDSTRPQASTRVGVESVSPIRELNFDGTILGAAMPLGVIPIDGTVAPSGREYKKLKFLLFKYPGRTGTTKTMLPPTTPSRRHLPIIWRTCMKT